MADVKALSDVSNTATSLATGDLLYAGVGGSPYKITYADFMSNSYTYADTMTVTGTVDISGGTLTLAADQVPNTAVNFTGELNDIDAATFSAGDVLYHNGTNLVQLAKGTAGQVLAMNSGATAPEWGGTFTKTYYSTGQTIVDGGLSTLAHGMAVVPTLIQIHVECTTASEGFSIGDKLVLNPNSNEPASGTNPTGMAVYFDTTNVYVEIATSGIRIINKSGGTSTLNNSNWDLYVRAYA